MRVFDWLRDGNQRQRATRYEDPGLVAFYWDGSSVQSKRIKDVSVTGAYLYTDERWYPGTVLEVLLKRHDEEKSDDASFGVPCEVVRNGRDGIAMRFLADGPQKKVLARFVRGAIGRGHAKECLVGRNGTKGQALVELALVLPLIFLFIVNTVNFGGWLYDWVTVGNAARVGANYAALGASSVDYPAPPAASDVVTMVQNDTSSLPNWSTSSPANPTVTVCQNYNGTVTLLNSTSACPTGVTAPPVDPEPTNYTSLAIDVTYTYHAFIPLFAFPSLGIYATIPTSTIHRRAVMRVLN